MKQYFFISILLFISLLTKAQGCSDAGGCSAGHLGMNYSDVNKAPFTIAYTQTLGLADKESLVSVTQLGLYWTSPDKSNAKLS